MTHASSSPWPGVPRCLVGEQPLCFGRLDTDGGDRLYIGRLGVSDETGGPLMVDWRAPVAEAFYRATSADRRGVVRRRHIRMKGRRVVGLDDELLARKATGASRGLVGEAALLSTLEHARTGRIGDIVATIQAEQDAAIRALLRGVLVVQGGPGTGKTAVALHRAAYLLYAHQFPLASQGVLVVGPNPVFCRYVGDVLPGWGRLVSASRRRLSWWQLRRGQGWWPSRWRWLRTRPTWRWRNAWHT